MGSVLAFPIAAVLAVLCHKRWEDTVLPVTAAMIGVLLLLIPAGIRRVKDPDIQPDQAAAGSAGRSAAEETDTPGNEPLKDRIKQTGVRDRIRFRNSMKAQARGTPCTKGNPKGIPKGRGDPKGIPRGRGDPGG